MTSRSPRRWAHSYNPPHEIRFEVRSALGPNERDRSDLVSLCTTQYDYRNPRQVLKTHHFCGDANVDERVSASDALFVLQASVGMHGCGRSRCDVDYNFFVGASDALRILRYTVGHPMKLLCSGCGN